MAITGAPHNHSTREINNEKDLTLNVYCMSLNKTFKIEKVNPEDSLFIKSSSFKNPKEKKLLNKNKSSDSTRFYNWRIGDMKFHKGISKDTIEIIKLTKNGNKINYKFVIDSN